MNEIVQSGTEILRTDAKHHNRMINSEVQHLMDHFNPTVREVTIPKLANGACGFDLSRSKWDPYPWVRIHIENCVDKLR